ncbi:MAG: hypothetical protein AAF493_12450, partial [Pseudomonadota bacterium]
MDRSTLRSLRAGVAAVCVPFLLAACGENELASQLEQAKAKIAKLELQTTDLDSKLKVAMNEGGKASQAVAQAGAEVQRLQAMLNDAQANGEGLSFRLNEVEEQAKTDIEEAEAAVADAQAESARLTEALTSAQSDSEAKIAQLNDDLKALRTVQASATSGQEKLDQAQAKVAALEGSLAEAEETEEGLQAATTVIGALQSKVADLSNEVAAAKAAQTEAQAALSARAAELATAKSAAGAAAAETSRVRGLVDGVTLFAAHQQSEAVANLAAQSSRHDDATRLAARTRADLDAGARTIFGLREELFDLDADVSKAKAANQALQTSLIGVRRQRQALLDAKRALETDIATLSDNLESSERVKNSLISRSIELQAAADQDRRVAQMFKTQAAAAHQRLDDQLEVRKTISTLRQSQIDLANTVKAREADLGKQNIEIKRLTQLASASDQLRSQLASAQTAAVRERQGLTNRVSTLRSERDALQYSAGQMEGELRQIKGENAVMAKALDVARATQKELRAELTQVTADLERDRVALGNLRDQHQKATALNRTLSGELSSAKAALTTSREALTKNVLDAKGTAEAIDRLANRPVQPQMLMPSGPRPEDAEKIATLESTSNQLRSRLANVGSDAAAGRIALADKLRRLRHERDGLQYEVDVAARELGQLR